MGSIAGVRAVIIWWRRVLFIAILLIVPLIFVSQSAANSDASLVDVAPFIVATHPTTGAVGVPLDTVPRVTFSEAVSLDPGAMELVCSGSGAHALTIADGPTEYRLLTSKAFLPNETCAVTVFRQSVHDRDTDDPPDVMSHDGFFSFTLAPPVAENVVINELNAVTTDGQNEFIELYDGGAGGTDLTGLIVVLYNGSTDKSYLAISLAGHETDANGYFLLASGPLPSRVPLANGLLLDGPAAVALYAAPPSAFPYATPVTVDALIDAIVYDSGQADDSGLLVLLEAGQPQVDEGSRGHANEDTSQRCPNGAGGQRQTDAFLQNTATPAAANNCLIDLPPQVTAVTPANGSSQVPPTSDLSVTFNEPVILESGFLELRCGAGALLGYSLAGGPTSFTMTPNDSLPKGVTCTALIRASKVRDQDTNDPPDLLGADYWWEFQTESPVATNFLINEFDSDTPGSDQSEFIELYDGGTGNIDLTGLTVVLYNGSSDISYRSVNLSGKQTDNDGYFIIGSASIGPDLLMPDAWLQNGTDGIALYAAPASAFPNGSAITTDDMIDAVVYRGQEEPSSAMAALLLGGDLPVDEGTYGTAETDSNQRCPNGSGGARRTATFGVGAPTVRAENSCRPGVEDAAPTVLAVSPASGAADIPLTTTLSISFSEPVALTGQWLRLNCEAVGDVTMDISGGSQVFTATPTDGWPAGDRCTATIARRRVTDLDEDDPPDEMDANFVWSFETVAVQPPAFATITELDSDTPGSDTAEFIELYDGGGGATALDGLTLVLYNGATAKSYAAFSLDGQATNDDGFFVAGNAAVAAADLILPNGSLQNGPDAVALYAAPVVMFPSGTPVTTTGLLDAIVYGPPDDVATALLPLLVAGQTQASENAAQGQTTHSLQRCPVDGAPRRSDNLRVADPTPGFANTCVADLAPTVTAVLPEPDATGVPTASVLTVTFSEPVSAPANAFTVVCSGAGDISLTVSRPSPDAARLLPNSPLPAGETCMAKVRANSITDLDHDDPPDRMAADYQWQFTTAAAPVATILINEVDADTPGTDTAEFVELYDGGEGETSLDGLVLVLFDGRTDVSYRAIGLSGHTTGPDGYFVVGGEEVAGRDLTTPPGALQNGADAVALYAGAASDFPAGTSLTTVNLIDALVYDTGDPDDPELLTLLLPGQPQIDENGRGNREYHSSQRCPNGSGGPRSTQTYAPSEPSPGGANSCLFDSAPQVLQTLPAGGDSGVALDAVLTVTFSEPVTATGAWLSLSCGQSGDHSLTVTSGPASYRLVPDRSFAGGERCDATIHATAIADIDNDDPPDALESDYTWAFTTAAAVCGQPSLPIAAIQGSGATSPLLDAVVTIEGIVTGQVNDEGILYTIQTPAELADGLDATSDALFAHVPLDGSHLIAGDHVRLSGLVAEEKGRTVLGSTTLLAVCDTSVEQTPKMITLPPASVTDWEHVEAMLLQVSDPLTVVDNTWLGSEGRVTLSSDGRPAYPTQWIAPGPGVMDAIAAVRAQQLELDDGLIDLPPDWFLLGPGQTVRRGDMMAEAIGIADPAGTTLRLQAQKPPSLHPANLRFEAPARVDGALRLLSLDVDGLARLPGEATSSYLRQRDKLLATVLATDADLVAVLNLGGSASDQFNTLADLVTVLGSAGDYASVYASTSGLPTSAGWLYRTSTLEAVAGPTFLPEELMPTSSTPPALQRFRRVDSGEELTVVTAIYPDRADCPAGGADADQDDGQGCNNARRVALSEAVASWLSSAYATERIILFGQLNAPAMEEPVQTLLQAGWVDLHELTPVDRRYTTILGTMPAQTHFALASPLTVPSVARAATWHSNADEPAAFDWREGNPPDLYRPDPFRSAAVDPLVVDLAAENLVAGFISNSPITIGETAVFTSTSQSGGTLALHWDLGDDTVPQTGDTVTHLYTQPREYEVTLTVSGSGGEATVTQQFMVNPRHIYLPLANGGSLDRRSEPVERDKLRRGNWPLLPARR